MTARLSLPFRNGERSRRNLQNSGITKKIHLLLFFSFPSFRKIHFSGVQITNEVVDVVAALKPPEWASRTRQSLSMT